jgi:3-dehydroquinate synthase
MARLDCIFEVWVSVPTRSYPIIIGDNLLSDKKRISQYVIGHQAMIVSNKTVAPLYLSQLQQSLIDKQCDVVLLDDGEQYKNQQSLTYLLDNLLAKNHHRDTTLIALGGGVIGDLTGFAASIYRRGVNFLQIPTTLLAQVDASVGGKTAINHPLGKNMIGSFYQPCAVISDSATLTTLPMREFNAGFAEIIKYALLCGGNFLLQVQKMLQTNAINPSNLKSIINQCCQIKARFVKQDEQEKGVRVLLNLGHTIAHALEAYTHYKRWLHGEAVSIGLYCAALLSYQVYGLDKQSLELIDRLLMWAKLPRRIPNDIDLKQLQELMSHDKKNKNNTLCFIIIKKLGTCYLEEQISNAHIQTMLQSAVGDRL